MIDQSMPYHRMHAVVVCGRYTGCGGPSNEDAFTCLLYTYQQVAHAPEQLDTLADICERRQKRRSDLSGELFNAYGALSGLARWRAAQLREGLT